jgi:hypothetical protein
VLGCVVGRLEWGRHQRMHAARVHNAAPALLEAVGRRRNSQCICLADSKAHYGMVLAAHRT